MNVDDDMATSSQQYIIGGLDGLATHQLQMYTFITRCSRRNFKS